MITNKRLLAHMAFGMAFYWAMLRRSYFGLLLESHSHAVPDSQVYYSFFLLGLVLSIIVAARFRTRIEACLLKNRVGVLIFSSLSSLGAFVIQLCPTSGLLAAIIIVGSLMILAADFALLTFAWGTKAFLGGTTKQALLTVILSFFLSYVIALFLTLPEPIPLIVAVLAPLLSAIFWYMQPEVSLPKFELSAQTSFIKMPLGLIGLLVAFLLVGGAMRGISYQGEINYIPSYDTFLPTGTSAIFAGIIFLMVFFSKQREKLYYTIWIMLAMLYFAGLFVVAFMSPDTSNLATSVFLIPGRTCLAFLLWLTLLASARTHGLSPVLLFNSFFLTTEVASNFLSYIAFPLLMPHFAGVGTNYTSVFAAVMALMLIIASMVMLTNKAFSSDGEPLEDRARAHNELTNNSQNGSLDSWSNSCTALATKAGLTKREEEVMVLFSQGNSKSKIADMLYVSEGTVKTHIKSMYRKLDVHSRQELIDLVRKEL